MNESLVALRHSIEKVKGLMELYDELAGRSCTGSEAEEAAAQMMVAKEHILKIILEIRKRIADIAQNASAAQKHV